MAEYIPTIGLEIHVQLKTKTKLFSKSLNNPDEKEPNVNVSPVDLAHPGTLPVINKEAIKKVLKVGVAINAQLADFTEWDRKHYFYPDIPKAYQISQNKHPLIQGGELKGVAITRIHLEEDTGRSIHDQGEMSLVDYNRAGMPLMELVTEPVIHSSEQAASFARELQLLLRTLGVSDANMEKGEMRVEANISVSKTGQLGTKVEVKNINSFKVMEKAVEYEIARHIEVLDTGGIITQETRGWDESNSSTFSQRAKEDAHDYRYFPDPDIPKMWISEIPDFQIELLKSELPELPNETRNRLIEVYNINSDTVEELLMNPSLLTMFNQTLSLIGNDEAEKLSSQVANILLTERGALISSNLIGAIENIQVEVIADIVRLANGGELSSRGVKDVLAFIYQNGGSAQEVANQIGAIQQNDEGALVLVVESIISEQSDIVNQIKEGKIQLVQFLIGQAMKVTKGAGNPQILKKIFEEKIGL